MRLDKWVSQSLGVTRSQAKKLITKRQVKLDDLIVTDASVKLDQTIQVKVNDKPLKLPQKTYLALYKPAGYICSTQDENYPSALNLLTDLSLTEKQKSQLHFAGRLDVDTTGLVLISDDGQWTHRVTSPRKKQPKVYRVTTSESVEQEQVNQLQQGVLLKGEDKKTLPAQVDLINQKTILLTIVEGRYHQVKRMLTAVGNNVESLHREQVGEISLQEMKEGEYRRLDFLEVESFG